MSLSPTKIVRLGDCFSAAAKFISAHEVVANPRDYSLVHGNLRKLRQDVRFNHAWVEEADFVREVSNGQNDLISRDLYYKAHEVTIVRKYTPREALALMILHGHWGPWE